MGSIYLIIAVIIILIAISFLFDFNIGPLAVLAAMIIGKICMGYGTGQIIGMVPGNTLLTIIILSAFYGFALENGTAQILIENLLDRFGAKTAFLPVLIFLMTMVLSGIGLGSGNATMIMAPIALGIAAEAGIEPIVMAMAVSCGAASGSNFPFSFGGAIASSLIAEGGYLTDGVPVVMDAAIRNTLIQITSFLLVYFWKKGYRAGAISKKEIPVMTKLQKKTCCLTATVVSCSVLPLIISVLYPHPLIRQLAGYLDINVVMLVGIIAAMGLRLADERIVVKERVPWLLIIVISGMSMMIGIARENGIIDLLGQALKANLPESWILYTVILISMIMSLFSGAISVVVPTLYPMVPGITAGMGIDMGLLYGGILNGATCGGTSPYSTGGMIILSAYPKLEKRRKFLLELMIMPFFQVVIAGFFYTVGR